MTLKERARLIRSTKQMHSTWYRETYPDVASLGMDSAEHYLKYGAAMGRNPGKNFDTKFYLAKHPDLATLSITPLEHYATIGRARGSATSPSKPHAYVQKIRKKLFTLGFTEKPLAELQDIAFQEQDLCAAEEALFQLAMWHIRQKTPSDYETALDYIDRAFRLSPSSQRKSLLATCKLVTLYYCHRSEEAKHFYNSVALDAAVDANVLLAYSNHFESIHIKLSLINTALSQYDLPPLRLLPANGLSLYDRLTSAIPLQKITEGPKVTVLIAAYNCAETLPTALRSLSEQTWQNLEIIVIDDCSPSPQTLEVANRYAAADPRIRVIAMEQNVGAYAARNYGLKIATGEFIALHDADDWAHPTRIERQVRFLQANPDVIGCMSQQSRATDELEFLRLDGRGALITTNICSFMYRRQTVLNTVGEWDTVRFGADTELIKRIQRAHGGKSVRQLYDGPAVFQRMSNSSIVGDPYFGIEGLPYGARYIYHDAFSAYHAQAAIPRMSSSEKRPFPVPRAMMRSGLERRTCQEFDVILATDFRAKNDTVKNTYNDILHFNKFGFSQAHFHIYQYDIDPSLQLYDDFIKFVPQDFSNVLVYGEEAKCDLLIIRNPLALLHHQRYLPTIQARNVRVIVDCIPLHNTEAGTQSISLAACARNIRSFFGTDAIWHAADSMTHTKFVEHYADQLHHIHLSGDIWPRITKDTEPAFFIEQLRTLGAVKRIKKNLTNDKKSNIDC